jgi:hypothetical protein
VTWWAWLIIVLGGLAFAALTRRGIARRTAARGGEAEREGPWSLLYYIFIDWWIDWL